MFLFLFCIRYDYIPVERYIRTCILSVIRNPQNCTACVIILCTVTTLCRYWALVYLRTCTYVYNGLYKKGTYPYMRLHGVDIFLCLFILYPVCTTYTVERHTWGITFGYTTLKRTMSAVRSADIIRYQVLPTTQHMVIPKKQ